MARLSAEVAALLALDAAAPAFGPVATDQSVEPLTTNSNREKLGQFPLDPIARARANSKFTPEFRKEVAAVALPLIAGGASLREVAAQVGIDHKTLRGWIINGDEPAYREALSMQISNRLSRYAVQADECARDAELGASILRDPKAKAHHDRATALVRAARARSAVLRDAAAHWQWLGERRLPSLFGGDQPKAPLMRATFTFIIDGRCQPLPGGGRTIEQGELPDQGDTHRTLETVRTKN